MRDDTGHRNHTLARAPYDPAEIIIKSSYKNYPFKRLYFAHIEKIILFV